MPGEGRLLGQARARRGEGDNRRKQEEENWGSCKRRRPERTVEELTAAVAIDSLNGRPRRWNRSSRCLKLI